MKTAVIGAGAVGSLFASLLKTKNNDTVLFDTDIDKINYISRNGIELVFPESSGKKRIFPEAVSDTGRIRNYDYYLICVKSYSTEAAVKSIVSCAGENLVIVTFQNGMGNADIIRKYFPDTSSAAGTTSEGAAFINPATVIYGGRGKTALSMIDSRSNSKLMPLIDALNSCGLEAALTDSFRKDIWKKLIINAAVNPLTAVLKLENRYISESVYLRNITEMIIRETVKAAESDGIFFDIDDITNTVYTVAEKTGRNRSSMLQDIENCRKTEIDFISGAAAEIAEKNGIASPVNRIMQNIVKVLESRYFT